jgi:arginine decarboxylase
MEQSQSMFTSAVRNQIPVLRTTGVGGNTLSAFHDALVNVDLGFYNLVRLSSVVPPNTGVDPTGKAQTPEGAWGDRLYCVYAVQYATEVGEEAWSGIGWVQRLDGKGGLFVEHEGPTEGYVRRSILTSLRDLVKGREDEFAPPDYVMHGVVCTGEPTCSMVIAPYETQSWAGAR